MQHVETTRFGTIPIEESTVLTFISPILGFESVEQYVLLDHQPDSPFKWLQAVSQPDLAFIVTHPKFFNLTYEFTVPEESAERIEASDATDILVLTIVTIPNDQPAGMTANLMAPIVVNQNNRKAMQLILQEKHLSTATRLLPDKPLPTTQPSMISSGKDA